MDNGNVDFGKDTSCEGLGALRKALETVLIDPSANVSEVMQNAAQEAQTALDEILAE